MDDAGLTALLAASLGLMVVFFLILVLFYVLKSIALTTMASNRGIENPWLGWIPIADLYIAGTLLGDMDLFGYHLTNLGLWVPVVYLGGTILGYVPVLNIFTSIALLIFSILFVYNLFKLYTEQAVLYTVLSLLLGLWAVFLFVVRNNQPLIDNPIIVPPPKDF